MTALCLDWTDATGSARTFRTPDAVLSGETWNGHPAPQLPKWQAYLLHMLIDVDPEMFTHPSTRMDEQASQECAYVWMDGLTWYAPVVTDADLAAIAEALRPMSDQFDLITVEYPGCIHVYTEEGPVWVIGTANGPFGADYYTSVQALIDGHQPERSIETTVPTDSAPREIAESLYELMATDAACPECQRSHGPHYRGRCDH